MILVLMLPAVVLISCGQADHSDRIEKHKRLAGELAGNRLFQEAIVEYEKILVFDDLEEKQRANICYLIARICYENLTDYRRAAAYYVRAREYDPLGSFVAEANKNLVASLEKLGNVLDARRQLGAAANLDHQPVGEDDVVVAKIGDRDIWLSEIDQQITLMPPDLQKQLATLEAKRQYVHQYVGVELLYNAAVREDYLAKPEIQRQKEQMLKTLAVDRFVADKVMPQVSIDTVDVRNYYEANKDALYEGLPYDSVRYRVYRDYQSVKAEAAYGEYIQRLAQAERVEFRDQNVR
jgi:tetratricopeptide (TPR) repeat protein